jgi:hypothetical protein
MVNKKMTMRDYYRSFITKANKEAGVTFNASKLNSKEECEEYLLNLIKNLRHNAQPTKIKNAEIVEENKSLKNEIENLRADNGLYIVQLKNTKRQLERAENNKEFYKKSFEVKSEILEETAIKTLRFRKKLALSNFLLATVTIFVVLEFIIIIALIRGAY